MADIDESLDFLALLDEVADDTVSRLMYEMDPDSTPCALGDRDTFDMLSICDSTSADDNMMSSAQSCFAADADDSHEHVHLKTEEETGKFQEASLSFPATGHAPPEQNSPAVVLQLTPPSNQRFFMDTVTHGSSDANQNAQGQSQRRRSRWQFSKAQREQLDAVFNKNMYPSKWRITELSRTLNVPMHTLRVWFQNRRWRLRKSNGINGDLHTRGSRTMLPDKGESTAQKSQRPTSSPHSSNPSPGLSNITPGQTSEMKSSYAPPLITTSSVLLNSTSTPNNASHPSPLYSLLSAPRPLYEELGQRTQGYNWGMPGLVSGWKLPQTLYWSARAQTPPAFPLTYSISPWQNYGLSLMPRLYSSDWGLAQRQNHLAAKSEKVDANLTHTCLSYSSWSVSEPRSSPVLPSAYPCYTKSSLASPAYCPSALIHPVKMANLDQPTRPVSSTAVHNSSPMSEDTDAVLMVSDEDPATPEVCSDSDVPIFPSAVKSVDSPNTPHSAISGVCAFSNAQHTSNIMTAASVPSAVQRVCPCTMCLTSASSHAWPTSLPYPMESMLRPLYPAAIHPSFPAASAAFLSIPPQVGSKHGSIMPFPETSTEAKKTSQQNKDEASGRNTQGMGRECEMVDVTTVSRTKEEEISSTSDETK